MELKTTADFRAAMLRFECLKLAHGESNRATATEQGPSKKVIERARLYADFVLEKP